MRILLSCLFTFYQLFVYFLNHSGGSPNSSSQQNQRAPHAQDNLNYDPDLPAPPQDNNQVAAWYDTDL